MKRSARLETHATLERGEPLRPKRWGTRPAPKTASWRDEYMPERMAEPPPKYTAFELARFGLVRSLPCSAAHLGGCWGPIEVAHIALSANDKGTGMKVPHSQTAPLCHRHHADWDGRNGQRDNPFSDLSRDDRYVMGAEWVELVHFAATPGDSLDDARELERLGLGKVIGNGRDGWQWWPGHLTEVDAGVLAGEVSA